MEAGKNAQVRAQRRGEMIDISREERERERRVVHERGWG